MRGESCYCHTKNLNGLNNYVNTSAGLSDEKNTEEEASSRHEGESSSLDSSDSDDNDDDNEDTGAKDNTCYGDGGGANAGNGNGGGDRNTGTGGVSVEWMRFLSPSALSETLGATAKSNTSSSTKSRRIEVGK